MFDLTTPEQAGELEESVFTGTGKRILCRYCHGIITDHDQETTHQGQFIHQRINPAGFTYEFGCYAGAPGCSTPGKATIEHTWFPGYGWKPAICRSCGEHLGWLFEGEASFYGLIQDRLVHEN